MKDFKYELRDLINRHSIERHLDMPDYLIAELIVNLILAIGEPMKQNLDWHGVDSVCHPMPSREDDND